jgi:hypothetical protein
MTDPNETTDNSTRAPKGLLLPGLLVVALLSACADSNNSSSGGDQAPIEVAPVEVAPFQELYDQGVTRYLGEYTPMLSTDDGTQVNHTFGAGDGPLCINGSEYAMSTRDAGSEDLVIFLEGGGACWPGFPNCTQSANPQMSNAGILDPNRSDNPVKDWNVAYLPYCDGGLHISDVDSDSNGSGEIDWTQRGLHNLSASLDVTVNLFPSPRRILITGNSAGGFGSTYALTLVRYLYPDTKIEIVNDSGVGIGQPGNPAYTETRVADWNAGAFIPESCDNNCIGEDGHSTEYLIWQMEQDPTLRRSMLSYNRDALIADFFLMIGQDAFEEALYEEMQQLEDAFPDRTASWIPAGTTHTVLQLAPDETAGGVPLMDWIGFMLDDTDEWVSVRD